MTHNDTAGGTSFDTTRVVTFAEFYREHHSRVARALAVNLGSQDLGRTAADEAMTRAYANWATVATYSNPAGWVYRVGLNWARSWARKTSRRLPWNDRNEASMPQTSDPDLRAAIGKLDPKYRDVVVCRYFFDWSTDQTAEALELKPGTVKSRLSTGLGQLRAALGEP